MILSDSKETILAVGDLHSPFIHKDAVKFLALLQDHFNPTKTVLLGDEADLYALSRYTKDPGAMSIVDEHNMTIKNLQAIYKIIPKAMVCNSNHMDRLPKKAMEAGIPSAFLAAKRELMQAPTGWVWDSKWTIDDIIFEHGEGFSGATAHTTATLANMKSTVIGHIHSHAGISYVARSDAMLFGMNVGCLIDYNTYAFSYSKHSRFKPTIGCGIIVKGVPLFIPMLQDSNLRFRTNKQLIMLSHLGG